MHYSLTTLWIILIGLIILSAFFSASEIGMMSLNRYRLRHFVKKNHKQAIRVNEMLAHPDKLLGVVLIGNTIANIVASTIATLIAQRLYGDAGIAIETFLLTLIILIFSEMTPKTFAAIYPEKVAFSVSFLLKGMQYLFAPLVSLISSTAKGLLQLLGISFDASGHEMLSGEEFRTVIHEASCLLPSAHKGMLISLLDLEQAKVEDIMIPKTEILGIDLDSPWPDILFQFETARHTRLALFRDNIEQLLGIVHLRDILNLSLESRLNRESLLAIAEPPYFIPEATPLNVQLMNFQKMKRRSCFVVDEYGSLRGLVTMEDILEEVVGEFTTEVTTLSQDITRQDDGSVIVDASMMIRQLNRIMKWNLPLIGPRTLSGLIIEHLGYIPPKDCCLAIKNYQIEILKVGENTIKSAKVIRVGKKRIG